MTQIRMFGAFFGSPWKEPMRENILQKGGGGGRKEERNQTRAAISTR